MLLSPPTVPVTQFTWDPASRTFSAEISDLPGLRNGFERVWDDAVDEGCTLASRHSGQAPVVFAIETEQRDADNDVLWWDLKPAEHAMRQRYPFTVRIFND